MLVVLSAGILTALTGTGISQVAPAFADKEECEDNDDNLQMLDNLVLAF